MPVTLPRRELSTLTVTVAVKVALRLAGSCAHEFVPATGTAGATGIWLAFRVSERPDGAQAHAALPK